MSVDVISVPGSTEFTRAVIDARSRRRHFLPAEIFKDLSWDILLELYHRAQLDKPISVSGATTAGRAAGTTGLSHVRRLIGLGLIERHEDQRDSRRSWVRLSHAGTDAMNGYFASLAAAGWSHDPSNPRLPLTNENLIAMVAARLRCQA